MHCKSGGERLFDSHDGKVTGWFSTFFVWGCLCLGRDGGLFGEVKQRSKDLDLPEMGWDSF